MVTIVLPAIGFLLFLWSFRVTRLIFLKSITCPETRRGATVELLAHRGQVGTYQDVRACSLPENERGITCGKVCLTSPEVLAEPYISVRKV
jgi:hypothetical protein